MLPDYPIEFWLCAVAAVVFVGIAKAGFGGGVGVVATPLMALSVSVAEAAAIMLPLLMVCDFFSVRHYRGEFDRRSVAILLPAAAVGIAVGIAFFDVFSGKERVLKIGLGVLALSFVLFQALRAVLLGALGKSQPPTWSGLLLGGVAGFTSTLAHAGGPPVTVYLLPQGLPRQTFVGTTVILFAAINLIKLGPYCWLGLYHVGNLATILVLSPLAYVGVVLGIWLNRRFTDLWFNRLVYGILLLTGLQLVLGRSLLGTLLG